MKTKSVDDLMVIRRRAEGMLSLREKCNAIVSEESCGLDKGTEHIQILCCGGTGCKASESALIAENLQASIKEHGIADKVDVITTGCFGFCEKGPIVKIIPDNTFYTQVTPDDAEEIVREHIVKGNKVERLLYLDPKTLRHISDSKHMNFYGKQIRIALRNCGFIDPENIEEYIARDGYQALADALTKSTPEEVIEKVKASGLRGRGGAGFPTGKKWEFSRSYQSDEKYVVCNADEGDPGAFMDRSIMEGDPNSIVEAMTICGYCIGSHDGLIYIRAEYPLAVHRIQVAIEQAREYGFLGKDILGTGFDFDIEIRYGAGAFVCGEETALIHSMEGKRGEPTLKPPFPAESGYLGKPTNVNNVETLANIPIILTKGAEWFSSIGTEKSKGTKVFALAGKINNVGLIEVPMGTTLREIIYDIGGGVKNGKKFKAVQTGGPSGGCLTEKHLDIPIDYESLTAAGSMMGSGGMIVMDEDDCMVSVAKFYLEFTVGESCGKCTPCRIGNKRMLEILTRITEGNGEMADLQRLKDLATVIKDTALCGLGQTSPNPVLSTINNFYDEYVEHVKNRKCRSKKCKALLTYTIDPAKCKGCGLCAKDCPASAIMGTVRKPHVINPYECIRCGMCMSRCHFGAISVF
ncbi:MAG: NADH-quinone oxidoreductase subunit NuoF [Candidatus Cryptobacteroides sp.]|jgi:NADH-quinone oxidoreductase subunit F/NADP-reducing hydrogenase subunit HndC|nr:NADH-quinone oxidoreductase subunit NuoF [Bacteroidales bacterium]MDY2936679.1 NADH-quinone oxidoreductase subunit NuoF [Candidatus Cryptobacteroides sp.]MDD7089480.1 NADH-quinone oxidoreductase subunit NuoF [Bacteroidales bacterium]MDY6321189.1 NADH-quinone oxidoreductase subunit NuoF [Bacteroidales bacterium]MDY6377329.1 NADH-quinone oxidoreductase subunit NuoF [Bacteroidales bacterium]